MIVVSLVFLMLLAMPATAQTEDAGAFKALGDWMRGTEKESISSNVIKETRDLGTSWIQGKVSAEYFCRKATGLEGEILRLSRQGDSVFKPFFGLLRAADC